jgi:hypothetical protein
VVDRESLFLIDVLYHCNQDNGNEKEDGVVDYHPRGKVVKSSAQMILIAGFSSTEN